MVWPQMGAESPFVDLRRLSDWFLSLRSCASSAIRPTLPTLHTLQVERLVRRLGATCVPLLGRELCTPGIENIRRRDAARAALAEVATGDARARVIAALHEIATSDAADEGKVCAVGLLAELGERGTARFADPTAIKRRSAIALAAQLDSAAELAAAADMMVNKLSDDDVITMLDVMAEVAPAAAQRLGGELCLRLDAAIELRDRIGHVLSTLSPTLTADGGEEPRRSPRPTLVTVLVDAAARLVVVASRKVSGERKWRRWAVLIGATGRIDDCLHEEAAAIDAAPLVANLVADGYHVASSDHERARTIVAAAARLSSTTTATTTTASELTSAYYLGRDLLDLGDAHAGGRSAMHPGRHVSATLGRAVELLAEADCPRAIALLARCDDNNPDVVAAIAVCALLEGRPADAAQHLARAITAEPEWPLHHWNLATACHQLGDPSGCYHALRRFVATSAAPTGLYADPDQPGRVALAGRLVAELERSARLTGTALTRPRRKRRTTRRSASRQP